MVRGGEDLLNMTLQLSESVLHKLLETVRVESVEGGS